MTRTRKLNGAIRTDEHTWRWGEWTLSTHWFLGERGARWMACRSGTAVYMTRDYRRVVRDLSQFAPAQDKPLTGNEPPF